MSEDRLINTSPRPRVLIRGFSDRPDLVEKLLKVAETTRHIKSLIEVRQAEWDVLITDRGLPEGDRRQRQLELHEHIHAICIVGETASDWLIEDNDRWSRGIRIEFKHVCQELRRQSDLIPALRDLVRELEPVLKARPNHTIIQHTQTPKSSSISFSSNSPGMSASYDPPPPIDAFIETADGFALAARYRRSPSAEAWILPNDTPDPIPWIRAAFGEWHSSAPDRFPGNPDWSRQPQWRTQREQLALAELAKLADAHAAAMERFAQQQVSLRRELAQAAAEADQYERALLTQQSDVLVQAVYRALQEIGFKATDVDSQRPDGDHLEDLRVEDPDVPGWMCLVEVKGLSKGAQSGAFAQFIRHQLRYQKETGQPADRLWYIVNQFKDRDPGARQPLLNGRDEDVHAFASVNGAVIDTIHLFHLLSEVRCGMISTAEARTRLREASGRFEM
ncbi:hypothetical protein [Acrocarpospora pleiomorpha]|nr:hypothetical protein [Acrocarpospora pleiomorpha]